MDIEGMESIVICPCCGEQVHMAMKPYREAVSDVMKMFEGSMGVGKTEHFEGEHKCKCGKTVTATLHVTAEAESGNKKRLSFLGL
jgi:hypothetical protein